MADNVSNLNLAKGSASPAEFAISCRGMTKTYRSGQAPAKHTISQLQE
jgi:hypothetical protein